MPVLCNIPIHRPPVCQVTSHSAAYWLRLVFLQISTLTDTTKYHLKESSEFIQLKNTEVQKYSILQNNTSVNTDAQDTVLTNYSQDYSFDFKTGSLFVLHEHSCKLTSYFDSSTSPVIAFRMEIISVCENSEKSAYLAAKQF